MRILILTHYFPPEPHKLISELAVTLRELGHEVHVITGFPHWPAGRIYPGYKVRVYQREQIDGARVHRFPVYADHGRNPLKRAWNFVSLGLSAAVMAPFVVPKCDVVHVISPPTLCLAGLVLSRLWGAPLTYEVQDMWPEALADTGMLRHPRALAVIRRAMGALYRRLTAVRVISDGFAADLIGKGVPPSKVVHIPNWVDTDFYRPVPYDAKLAAARDLAGKFVVIYAGNIGLAQGLGVILDAAERTRDLHCVHYVLLGDGVDLERLRSEASRRALVNVEFWGRVAPDRMPGLLALGDFLLIHLADTPLFRATVPHKTLVYLSAGKPVLAAARGEVAALIQSAGAGLVCVPGDGAALSDAVRRAYACTPAERAEFARRGRDYACAHFHRPDVVARIDRLFADLVARQESLG